MTEPVVPEPSPVPADRDLWPGELPFTAWGQHGSGVLDLRVFDQDIWWVDIKEVPHRLVEMSDEYLSNVIGFLLAYAEHFHADTVMRWRLQECGDNLLGRPSGEALARAAGVPDLAELAPEVWLESTPLMRALRRTLASRGES